MSDIGNNYSSPEKPASETVKNVQDNVSSAREVAGEDLALIRSDLAKLSDTVASMVSHQAEAARSTASTLYSGGRETLGVARVELQEMIERSPIAAIAAAFGAGLVIGMLNRSR